MPALSSYLDAFLAWLEVEKGYSRHTLSAYRHDLGSLLHSLSSEVAAEPSRLAESHIFAFLVRERRRGRAPSSVRRSLSAVKTFCRFLVKERVLSGNPAENLESPRIGDSLPAVLDGDQVRRLLEAVEDHPSRYPLRDRGLLELAYSTGLRVGELCGLDTRSVRADLGIVRCAGKGGRERVVPVSGTAIEAVRRYTDEERPRLAQHRVTDVLFLSRSGRPLGRESVRALLRRYALLAGVPGDVSPHMLRHSMATHLLKGGADLRVVQEILGHSKAETTEIYTHLDRSELKEAHRRYHPRG